MTATPRPTFDVTLKHLSPDGTQAGIEFLETPRPGLSVRELRQLLKAITRLAPSVEYPVESSLRIEAPAGRFLIQIKAHQLQFTSWSSSQAHPVTPPIDEMLRIFAGDAIEGELDVDDTPTPSQPEPRRRRRGVWIVALVAGIVGINTYTILDVRRPPGNFLPPHRLVTGLPATQTLEAVVGRYETGDQPGDRRLQINRDGSVEWIKYGPSRSVAQSLTFTVQVAESGGTPALLTSRESLIKIKDPLTLVYFGDNYSRITRPETTPRK